MKLSGHHSSLLVRLWRHLSKRRKRQFVLLLGLMMISVVAEVISLGAVVPFIGVLAAPDMVFEHQAVARLARTWGIASADQLVLPLTIAFALAAIISGAVRMLLSWASTRFTFSTGADLSREVYRRSLYQPYSVHIGRSSSQVIAGITSKVGATMLGVLLPLVTLVSSGSLLIAIMGTLIAIDPKVASIAAVGFGGSYIVDQPIRATQAASKQRTYRLRAHSSREGTAGRSGWHTRRAAGWYAASVLRRLSPGRSTLEAGAGHQHLHRAESALRDGGAWHGADSGACIWIEPSGRGYCHGAARPRRAGLGRTANAPGAATDLRLVGQYRGKPRRIGRRHRALGPTDTEGTVAA